MATTDENQSDSSLDQDARDQLAAITRGATSLVPLVGGILGEIITSVIPNQRADRIADYLKQLGVRLERLESGIQRQIVADKERIDLIEEGGYQAARSTSSERISQIAEAVFKGLTSEEADIVRRKRLVLLLGQIDDDEVGILNAYGQSYGDSAHEAWERVKRPDPAHMGSSVDEIDREKLFDAGRANLLRLGLLKKTYPFVRRGELPEFDAHGGGFKFSVEISYLGRMLLREIGLPAAIDMEVHE